MVLESIRSSPEIIRSQLKIFGPRSKLFGLLPYSLLLVSGPFTFIRSYTLRIILPYMFQVRFWHVYYNPIWIRVDYIFNLSFSAYITRMRLGDTFSNIFLIKIVEIIENNEYGWAWLKFDFSSILRDSVRHPFRKDQKDRF